MPDDLIVTVTDVHDDPTLVDVVTRDEASEVLVCRVQEQVGIDLRSALTEGTEVRLVVTPGQIIRRVQQASENFRKAAEEAVRAMSQPINEADAKILEQIQVVARAVAQHDAALAPMTRKPDADLFPIAQERRAAEAELNRLLMNRVNSLASSIRSSGLYN
jgi:hypothetical protein